MAFGAMLKNNAGSSIVGDGEQSYLYWGRIQKTITGSNVYRDAVDIALFNIPSSRDVVVFAYCSGGNALIITDNDGSTWNAKAYLRGRSPGDGSTQVNLYVFVQANGVVLPSYGMAIYEGNKVKWHSGRPCVNFKDYRYHNDNTTVLDPVVVSYVPAVIVGDSHGAAMIVTSPPGLPPENQNYDGYIWHIYAQVIGGVKQHGLISTRVSDTGQPWFYGSYYASNTGDLPLSYLTIDTAYYNKFSSLYWF